MKFSSSTACFSSRTDLIEEFSKNSASFKVICAENGSLETAFLATTVFAPTIMPGKYSSGIGKFETKFDVIYISILGSRVLMIKLNIAQNRKRWKCLHGRPRTYFPFTLSQIEPRRSRVRFFIPSSTLVLYPYDIKILTRRLFRELNKMGSEIMIAGRGILNFFFSRTIHKYWLWSYFNVLLPGLNLYGWTQLWQIFASVCSLLCSSLFVFFFQIPNKSFRRVWGIGYPQHRDIHETIFYIDFVHDDLLLLRLLRKPRQKSRHDPAIELTRRLIFENLDIRCEIIKKHCRDQATLMAILQLEIRDVEIFEIFPIL